MNNKNYVIIDNKKLFDEDDSFDDIPDYVEPISNEKSEEKEDKTEKGSGSETKTGLSVGIWNFVAYPYFSIFSKSLNVQIDLLEIKNIRILFKIIEELRKAIEKSAENGKAQKYFNDLIDIFNQVTKTYMRIGLKDLLKKDFAEKINWDKKEEQEKLTTETNPNISFEQDEEIVMIKKKLNINKKSI